MTKEIPIYELSVNVRLGWEAHSMSNAGTKGTNRVFPRRQLLSDGTETDAYSGNLAKYHHAMLTAEYMADDGVYLCAACAEGNGRRAGALDSNDLTMDTILQCGLCDVHGFLITAKNSEEQRQRLSKHSLIEFSFALALPESRVETAQVFTRQGSGPEGDGQMIYKKYCRSGQYAQCIRYKAVGVGTNTESWQRVIFDETERRKRHVAVLNALHDQLFSPSGAMTSTLLPQLTSIAGVIVMKTTVGRAPLYSPLRADFSEQLAKLADQSCLVYAFDSISEFSATVRELCRTTYPCQPAGRYA